MFTYKQEPNDDVLSYSKRPDETKDSTPEYVNLYDYVNLKQEDQEVDGDSECSGIRIKEDLIILREDHLECNERHRKESEEGTNSNAECTANTDTNSTTKDYTCPLCQKVFSNTSYLLSHINAHHSDAFPCEICLKIFYVKDHLRYHKRWHSERKFKCGDCFREFKTSGCLRRHKRLHLNLCCYLCGKKFEVEAELLKHRDEKHRRIPVFVCTVCNKGFKREYMLKNHLVRHTTEKPFNCELCKKKFKHEKSLQIHMQTCTHNGNMLYICTYCNKTFTHVLRLKKHTKKHTGEKPYPCPICGKKFMRKQNVARHKIKHENLKNCTANGF